MKEESKLIVAEQFDGTKLQFIIESNKVLGEGGFGVVKRAIRNDRPNDKLAVKIIPYKDESKRKKIESEIAILKHLPDHPNLVRVQPLKCYSKNNYYIFMEYCSGGTLEDLRIKKKNRFEEDEIFQIFYQLMRGYRVLWQAKILHQDLKLENVLIQNDILKLTDFGFSIFYEGVVEGKVRLGTLPYMPLEKLTVENYKASTKSDVYAMGIMLFKLITGHHPYVQGRNKQYLTYRKQLKMNMLYLRPNFTAQFSLKFKHFFDDIVLRMVSKSEQSRIDFDQIFQYIQTQQLFEQIHKKYACSSCPKPSTGQNPQKYQITSQSQAISIPFATPQQEQKYIQQKIENKTENKINQELIKIIEELDRFIVSHRVMVYFFDRLTRRIFVQNFRKKGNLGYQAKVMEKTGLSLLLFCSCIVKMILRECRSGQIFGIDKWFKYRKQNNALISMIEKDENYLEELIIDCISESSQTHIKQKKDLMNKSKLGIQAFKLTIKDQLKEFLSMRKQGLNAKNRQNFITICYVLKGIDILSDFEKWEKDGIDLQAFFREIETQDPDALFNKVVDSYLKNKQEALIYLDEEV